MSAVKWSAKGEKNPPLVLTDEFMILDSEDGTAATKNKRVTLTTVQSNLVTSVDANDFNITKLNSISINDSANDNTFTISSSVNLAADRIINLPLLTDDDTFAMLRVNNFFSGDNTFFDTIFMRPDDFNDTLLDMAAFGDVAGQGAIIRGIRSRGTQNTPSAVVDGDILIEMAVQGFNGTTFIDCGNFTFKAAGNFTDAPINKPCKFTIQTNAANMSGAPVSRLVIGSEGETSFQDNTIQDIASIKLNDASDTNTFTILGAELTGNFDVTIPAITTNDTFAMLSKDQTFAGANTWTQQLVQLEDATGSAAFKSEVYNDSDTFTPGFRGFRAKGTQMTPAAVNTGFVLATLDGLGHDGTSFALAGNADITANGLWSGTSHPTVFRVFTTAVDSITPAERLTVLNDGSTCFRGNSIESISSISLNSSEPFSYKILGGAISANTNVTIPDVPFDTSFAMLASTNVFIGTNSFFSPNLRLIGDGTVAFFIANSFDNGPNNTAGIETSRARGTGAIPLAVQTNDLLSKWQVSGATPSQELAGQIFFIATENWSVGNQGTKFQILNTANGGTVPTLNFEIEQDGSAIFKGNTLTNAVLALSDGSIFAGNENNVSKDFPAKLQTKEDCLVATTANITLANSQTIDTQAVVNPNRVLVKDQTIASENGIYVVEDAAMWNRSDDANISLEVQSGMFTKITAGSLNINTAFVLSTPDTINLNTTNLTFDKFSFADIAHLNSSQTFTGVNTFNDEVTFRDELRVIRSGSSDGRISVNSFSNTSSITAGLNLFRGRGTELAQLAVLNNDVISSLNTAGSTGTIFGNAGALNFIATENWSVGNQGAKFQILNTPNGGTVPTLSFEIDQDGSANFKGSTADTIASMSVESTGTNSGITKLHVGDRNPNGNVTAAGGAEYIRDSGAISKRYLNRSVTTGTVWDEYSINPPNVIEINTLSDFDDLATAGVITFTTSTTLIIKTQIITASRIVVNPGITLHITAADISGGTIVYSGAGIFITATSFASVRLLSGITLASVTPLATFMSFSGGGTLNIQLATLSGWDDLGTFANGVFLNSNVNYVDCKSGWTITNAALIAAFQIGLFATVDLLIDSLFTVNSNNPNSSFRFNDITTPGLSSTASIFNFSTKINNNADIAVSTAGAAQGSIFEQPTSPDATIFSVADSILAAGSVNNTNDNGAGGTRITTATQYFENEEVTITGTTGGLYDGTFQIFGVTATTFDIIVPFAGFSVVGTIVTDRIAMTLDAGHLVTAGMSIKSIDTQFYNAFYTVLDVPTTNVIIVNDVFIGNSNGTIKRNAGLDETDLRVLAQTNVGISDSAKIAFGIVNANVDVTPISTDAYVILDITTFTINQVSERFKLINSDTGEWRYRGMEDFKGFLTGSLTAFKAGATESYRFAISINGAVPVFVTADYIPVEVKTDKVNIALEFPVSLKENDTIQLMVGGDNTGSDITISDLTFGIK